MILKLREENQVLPSFESLMDDDSIVNDELSLLASNIRREVIDVLDFLFSFLKVYDKRKTHNMIFLMLGPSYKNLCIISSSFGSEQGVAFVEEYDRKSLNPMLVKCHEHLHPLVRSKTNFADYNIFNHDYSLDIFEQIASTNELIEELVKKEIANTSEPIEELVKKELLIFLKYQLDVKDIKCPLQW
jgi:hypothetical protein